MRFVTRQFLVVVFLLTVAVTGAAQPPTVQDAKKKRAESLVSKGLQLRDTGRHLEAVEVYREAVSLAREDWKIHHDLGVMLAHLRRYHEAARALARAVELDPRDYEARRSLCKARIALNQFQQAVACYENWMRVGTLDADSLAHYAYALNSMKRHEKAMAILQIASSQFPETFAVQNVLGIVFSDTKQYDKALAALRRAVELDPNYGAARYNLALVQIARKNRGGALEQYAFLQHAKSDLAEPLYALIFGKRLLVIKAQ